MSAKADFEIVQGETFNPTLRWEEPPLIYKPISAITKAGPAVITAAGHGLTSGWRTAIGSVVGMVEINAAHSPPWSTDMHAATIVDANTISLNDVNSAGFSTYVSGGYLIYNTPKDLTGYTARMSIKNTVGGTLLLALSTTDGTIVIDNTAKTISLLLSATATAALTWTKGVYDLEMVSAAGVVYQLLYGKIAVRPEVTT